MSKDSLEKVITDGVTDNLNTFFLDASNAYREIDTDLSEYDNEQFTGFKTLGEINFSPTEQLVVVTADVTGGLTERSGKKAQYEKAKKILKSLVRYDAGIFVFNDAEGNFRLSLVYGTPDAKRVVWSNFRRFTYYVSPALTNKTFKERVGGCSFTNLDAVKDAFSVEKVNKLFYQEIAKYYYRLTGKNGFERELTLPSVAADDIKKFEEFTVRLIGRIIFCWFLRHKKSDAGIPLIPDDVLSLNAAQAAAKYYHTILEPLFFEVMNKPKDDRKPVAVPQADMIPFLNGGLFEPHPNDYYENKPNYRLEIPDDWFGDFFTVLEQYNFTIDENSTVDADVSVDPEMLGRIFENLLAEVVPETGETARKATGSYYTPRIIVDYMVEQSLKQHLLTKTGVPEEKLASLLSYEDEVPDLSDTERSAVVTALREIKVIDPACGSGAFPMGILHRMLRVMEKVDPKLEIWRGLYLNSLDPMVRQIVMKNIRTENWAYIRKLMIIRDAIYGVDIQPVAVEISKLRCFLSLIVDEIVIDSEDNRDIEPLPNLEFKFVAANTLVGLPAKIESQGTLGVSEYVQTLKLLMNEYLRVSGKEKKDIEEKFRNTQRKLQESNAWLISDTEVKKIAEWDPFSYKGSTWFDPEWMFGIKDGFDIVIANPPYIDSELMTKAYSILRDYCVSQFEAAKGNWDIFVVFIEKGIRLLTVNGLITYIVPNKFLGATYSETLRKLILKYRICEIRDYSQTGVFESVNVYPIVFLIQKTGHQQNVTTALMKTLDSISTVNVIPSKIFHQDIYWDCYFVEKDVFNILIKCLKFPPISSYYSEISDASTVNEAYEIKKCVREYNSIHNVPNKKLINTGTIDPYVSYWGVISTQYIKGGYQAPVICDVDLKRISARRYKQSQLKKIIIGGMTKRLECYLDSGEYLAGKSTTIILEGNKQDLAYTTAILNSTLISFWYAAYFKSLSLAGGYLRINHNQICKIPIPNVEKITQDKLSIIVHNIVEAKKKDPYADTSTLEQNIDKIVNKLYDLTPEEIDIVEGRVK
ncbi:MAG: Eco57I restriction-modification methylase domain-containing protein [Dehalococcoidales bacterium]|nr:Eco57I restriction-modification methylase domain-containing protein [Dehalococcoidales bacterium]